MKILTCFNRRSLLGDGQVTKYFVNFKNEFKTSMFKFSDVEF